MSKEIIQTLLQSTVIAYKVEFAKIFKSPTTAIFLSQLLYWSGKESPHQEGWMYKTQAEFYDETGLTRYNIETARKKLEGVVMYKRKGVPAKSYYKINWDVLIEKVNEYNSTMMENHIVESGKNEVLFEAKHQATPMEKRNLSYSRIQHKSTSYIGKKSLKEKLKQLQLPFKESRVNKFLREQINFLKHSHTYNGKIYLESSVSSDDMRNRIEDELNKLLADKELEAKLIKTA